MGTADPYSTLSRNDLVLILEQQRQIAELQAELAQLRRAGKRQAAPFATGKRKATPKRPGRKPGQGTFRYRAIPRPEEITEPPVEVPVRQLSCPQCGGSLVEDGIEVAYRTELPAPVQPQVTQYWIEVCRCVECGQQVRGAHPDVAPDQYGASAHRLGERACETLGDARGDEYMWQPHRPAHQARPHNDRRGATARDKTHDRTRRRSDGAVYGAKG